MYYKLRKCIIRFLKPPFLKIYEDLRNQTTAKLMSEARQIRWCHFEDSNPFPREVNIGSNTFFVETIHARGPIKYPNILGIGAKQSCMVGWDKINLSQPQESIPARGLVSTR